MSDISGRNRGESEGSLEAGVGGRIGVRVESIIRREYNPESLYRERVTV